MTRQQHLDRMTGLVAKAQAEGRVFTADEQRQFNEDEASIKTIDAGAAQPKGKLTPVGQAPAVHTGKRAYSLSRLMRHAIGDRGVDAGYEMEVHQELARGRAKEPEGLLIPLMAFKSQDGITASPNTGQALTGIDQRDQLFLAVNNFFTPSVASRLGVTMTSTNEDKLLVPRLTARLSTGWVARDGTAATSSDATFDALTLQPTTLSLQFEMKRSLMYASHPMAEAILIAEARNAIEAGLDAGIISGTGASNQPLGLLGTGGANVAASITGAMSGSNAYDHSRKIRDEVEAYLKDANLALKWCLHPMHVAILKKTPAFSGALVPLVENGDTKLADREFIECYNLPVPAGGPPKTTKGLFGDFSATVGCVFGPAAELVLNPWADSVFGKGSVLARALVDFGVMHRDPKRILKFDTETL